MNTIPVQYEQNTELFADYRTPYKYNRPILAPSGKPGTFDAIGVDNMRIFRHKGRFYATYIGFDGVGYQTALAVSDDLLNRLSVRRRERIQKLLEQKKKQPKEEKKKESSGKGESSSVEDVSGNAEPIARMAEQQLSGVRRWLTVFHITRNPPEEAKRFSALCEEFVREMDRSSTDRRKAEVFLAFQQKIREGS